MVSTIERFHCNSFVNQRVRYMCILAKQTIIIHVHLININIKLITSN